MTFYDCKYRKIPDSCNLSIFLLGAVTFLAGQIPTGSERLMGVLITPLIPVICNFIRRGSFGGGDIKLLAACGFSLGWKIAIVGVAISIILCALYCILGILLSKVNRKTIFAFGPFICMGMLLADRFGEGLIFWYLQ
ncbi:MAG: A24 family peptidase [Dorea sp.]|nr:A24 family peptidase [Dorea sp.]